MAVRVSLPSAESAWRRPAERSQWLRPIEAARIARALSMRVVVKPDGTVEFDGIAPQAQFQQKSQHHHALGSNLRQGVTDSFDWDTNPHLTLTMVVSTSYHPLLRPAFCMHCCGLRSPWFSAPASRARATACSHVVTAVRRQSSLRVDADSSAAPISDGRQATRRQARMVAARAAAVARALPCANEAGLLQERQIR